MKNKEQRITEEKWFKLGKPKYIDKYTDNGGQRWYVIEKPQDKEKLSDWKEKFDKAVDGIPDTIIKEKPQTEQELKKQNKDLLKRVEELKRMAFLEVVNEVPLDSVIRIGWIEGIRFQKAKEDEFIDIMNKSLDNELKEAKKKKNEIAKQSVLILNMVKLFMNKKAKEVLRK